MLARPEAVLTVRQGLPPRARLRWRNIHEGVHPKADLDRTFFYLILLHVPLGVLMYLFSLVSIVHPAAVVVLGLYRAIQTRDRIERVAYVVAYLVGVEVLWRMAGVPLPWEFGKYGSLAIMVIALVRRGLVQIPNLPLLYLIVLIPGCLLTYSIKDWQVSRARLSFNMSGPLCLFVSCWFFSQMKLTPVQLKKVLASIAVPLVSVATATLFFTVTNPDLQFTNESNAMTSGGFGPNQVSAMLGLGVFLAASSLLLFKNDIRTAILLCVLSLLFAAQSVLTFSRGGIYAAVGALAALAVFQARDYRQFLNRFVPVVFVVSIFMFLIFPNLNYFTGGKLEERFESSDTTNRLNIVEMELQVFLENPFWGVGVGAAIDERYQKSRQFAASHTEFTRLVSEHGTFGVLAILALVIASIHNLRRQTTRIGKAVVAGAVVWSGLFMANAGMRLAAPAFMVGLSFVLVVNSIYQVRPPGSRLNPKQDRLHGAPLRK